MNSMNVNYLNENANLKINEVTKVVELEELFGLGKIINNAIIAAHIETVKNSVKKPTKKSKPVFTGPIDEEKAEGYFEKIRQGMINNSKNSKKSRNPYRP